MSSKEKKQMKTYKKVLIIIVICLTLGISSFATLLYGPWPNFRNWLITTAMTTMSHQYLATWFYSDKTIEEVLSENVVVESTENTDGDQISFTDYSLSSSMFLNKYEKEILDKSNESDIYKLINISEGNLRGYLVAIYDPSKVKVGTSAYIGQKGQMLTTIAKNNNAVVAMNASGFIDPNYMSNGGNPHGAVIQNGKIISSNTRYGNGGIIGFNKENKMILSRMSAEDAIKAGIRDAVDFGPFLIINGKPSFIKGNGGWGTAPRSAIAQRKDGIVLFLVMDGRDYAHGVLGADMVDLTEILLRYGAYNAANLDGGTSSGLVINNELINKPVNGNGEKSTRAIPDAWIVTQ